VSRISAGKGKLQLFGSEELNDLAGAGGHAYLNAVVPSVRLEFLHFPGRTANSWDGFLCLPEYSNKGTSREISEPVRMVELNLAFAAGLKALLGKTLASWILEMPFKKNRGRQ